MASYLDQPLLQDNEFQIRISLGTSIQMNLGLYMMVASKVGK